MKRIILIVTIVVIAVAIILAMFFAITDSPEKRRAQVTDVYTLYDEVATLQTALLLGPGHVNNPTRQELLNELSAILTDASLSPEQRFRKTQSALDLTVQIRGDIERLAIARGEVDDLVRELNSYVSFPHGALMGKRFHDLLDTINDRQDVARDIESVLYEINDQTVGILDTVISHAGELTDDHIRKINNETDQAEIRFERLSFLYSELEDITYDLNYLSKVALSTENE